MGLTRFLGTRGSRSGTLAAPARMVVGLGNPGPDYAANRHNVGFQVADLFATGHGLRFDKFQKRGRVALGTLTLPGGWTGRVLVVKPMTYMNASGEAVAALAAFYKIAPADILVVSDDLDLPVGKLRLRPGGGAGGQQGMKSLIQCLRTEEFPRLRVGIGRPPGQMDPADYVLQDFSAGQEVEMAFVRPQAAEAIEVWLAQGLEAAMNQFNRSAGKDE